MIWSRFKGFHWVSRKLIKAFTWIFWHEQLSCNEITPKQISNEIWKFYHQCSTLSGGTPPGSLVPGRSQSDSCPLYVTQWNFPNKNLRNKKKIDDCFQGELLFTVSCINPVPVAAFTVKYQMVQIWFHDILGFLDSRQIRFVSKNRS